MLSINNLSVSFNNKNVLKNICLNINTGEKVLITGPCSGGKTTLLYAIQKIIPDYLTANCSGNIDINSFPVMVFQNPESQIFLTTIEEELAFAPENFCIPPEKIRQNVDTQLKHFNFYNRRFANPSFLSGGEKQRLAIASVMTLSPDIILFDEPLSQLDNRFKDLFIGLIERLSDKTIIIAEHNIKDLLEVMDRIVIIDDGKIEFDKSIRELNEDNYNYFDSLGIRCRANEFRYNQEEKCDNEILKINNIQFSYNRKLVVNIHEFKLDQGGITGIYGKNGVGKTTLFKILSGFYKNISGTIKKPENISYIPQNPDLLLCLGSVRDEIEASAFNKAPDLIETVYNKFGLDSIKNKNPLLLSWGEKHNLAVAIGVASVPELLLLDEPFTSMDLNTLKKIVFSLKRFINQYNITVIINSHDIDLLKMFCDEIIDFDDINRI
ncbi:ATP-binding cassette domain-containing protein [Thermodesulfobacteriota bacterium]